MVTRRHLQRLIDELASSTPLEGNKTMSQAGGDEIADKEEAQVRLVDDVVTEWNRWVMSGNVGAELSQLTKRWRDKELQFGDVTNRQIQLALTTALSPNFASLWKNRHGLPLKPELSTLAESYYQLRKKCSRGPLVGMKVLYSSQDFPWFWSEARQEFQAIFEALPGAMKVSDVVAPVRTMEDTNQILMDDRLFVSTLLMDDDDE